MKNFFVLLICTLYFSCHSYSDSKLTSSELPSDRAYYEAVEKMLNGEESDMTHIRVLYSKTSFFTAGSMPHEVKKIVSYLNSDKIDKAYNQVKTLYKKYFADADYHYYAFLISYKADDEELMSWHKAALDLILKSITQNKDGKDFNGAFRVINTREERFYLSVNNIEYISQKLVYDDKGTPYDLFIITPDEHHRDRIFFNVELLFKGYAERRK